MRLRLCSAGACQAKRSVLSEFSISVDASAVDPGRLARPVNEFDS